MKDAARFAISVAMDKIHFVKSLWTAVKPTLTEKRHVTMSAVPIADASVPTQMTRSTNAGVCKMVKRAAILR